MKKTKAKFSEKDSRGAIFYRNAFKRFKGRIAELAIQPCLKCRYFHRHEPSEFMGICYFIPHTTDDILTNLIETNIANTCNDFKKRVHKYSKKAGRITPMTTALPSHHLKIK